MCRWRISAGDTILKGPLEERWVSEVHSWIVYAEHFYSDSATEVMMLLVYYDVH